MSLTVKEKEEDPSHRCEQMEKEETPAHRCEQLEKKVEEN